MKVIFKVFFWIYLQIVQLNDENAEKLKTEKTRKSDLMENLRKTRRRLEELTDEKNKLEQKLFGQFIPILHAKQVINLEIGYSLIEKICNNLMKLMILIQANILNSIQSIEHVILQRGTQLRGKEGKLGNQKNSHLANVGY